jgi:iron complex outermembrane recepter protein
LALLCVGLSLFAANAAFAQTPPSDTERKDETVKLEKFVVTGSFLPVSASVTASPVVTIESSEIGASGATDPLRMLRQLEPFFAGNGNVGTELNNGGAGESNVALRNLTTLVLINGQRIVGSGGSAGTATDLNIIPTAMIERVEILKDSASTIYGTDAIGGVVNFILKKNYNGFETGVRTGMTKERDYQTRDFYVMGGVSSPGSSLTFGVEHSENTPLLTTDRHITVLVPAEINAMGFNVTSVAFSGSYAGRIASDVLAGSKWIAIGAPGFNAAILNPGIKAHPSDAAKTLAQLEASGIYLRVATTPVGLAAGSNGLGTATALNTTLFGNPVIINNKRNSFVANFDKELVGKQLEVFSDVLYAQTTTGGSGLAPSPLAGVGPGGGNSLFIPANNPYNVFNVDFPGPLAARTRLEELGKRFSLNETDTWRLVAGLKGEINDKYSWEASFNYSRSGDTSRIFGGANGANMNKAMVPLLNGDNYVYDSKGRPLSTLNDSSGNPLPVYSFFALPGFNAQETLDALKTTMFQFGDSTMRNYAFVLRGKPYELPAGEVGFALGTDQSKETVSNSVDALFANGLALGYNAAASFSGGSRSSRGYFLEVAVPVVSAKQNIAGLHTLDLNLADRYQKILPGGNANSPKFGIRWMPIDDQFVIRGTWGKGFIAPAIISLFGPGGQNSPSFVVLEGNGSTSSGGSTGRTIQIQGSSVELSNPQLPNSKSTSYTAGFVYSPKQVKGLTFSADYYHILQEGGVGGIDYTTVVADMNAKGSGSVFAGSYLGLPTGFVFADGTKLTTTAPNQVTSTNFGTLTIANNPSGSQWTDGLDLAVDYAFQNETFGRFTTGIQANVLFNYKFRSTPSDAYIQYARDFTDGVNGLGGANGLLPSYILKPYVNHRWKSLSTSLFLTYIPAVRSSGSLFDGQSSTNSGTISGKAAEIPSYFTADLTLSYTLPDFGHGWLRNLTVTAGANNLFNKQPPYVAAGGNGSGENNTVKNTYDIIGRYMFMELKKAF